MVAFHTRLLLFVIAIPMSLRLLVCLVLVAWSAMAAAAAIAEFSWPDPFLRLVCR